MRHPIKRASVVLRRERAVCRPIVLGVLGLCMLVVVAGDALAAHPSTLTLSKTPDAAEVSAGTSIGYRLTVTNRGAAAANNVRLTDTLPANPGARWTINPAVSDCSISGGVLSCAVRPLASGASVSVHVVSPTSAATCGTVNNSASVTMAGGESIKVGPASIAVRCKASPTISTVASPASGTAGVNISGLRDTATFSNTGTAAPTGTVSFRLYSDAICTTPVPGVSGSGSISTNGGVSTASYSTSWTPSVAGTYHWIASYAGDANNNGFSTMCGDAGGQVGIGKASPTISTVATPSSGTAGVNVGDLRDTATFSNTGAAAPTGNVSFRLYSDAPCTTPVPGVSGSGSISTNGGVSTASYSTSWTPPESGTYHWIATYAGDANNNAFTATCGDGGEQIVVVPPGPSVVVSPTSGAPFIGLSVSGGGWPAGESIAVSIAGSRICSITADPNGNITADAPSLACRVPALPAGSQSLTARSASGVSATGATFTVTPLLDLPTNDASNPVAAGADARITGWGFAANSTVTSMSVDTTTATTNPATPFSTTSAGTFGIATNVFVTIPAATSAGAHTLNATDAAGNTASMDVTVYRPTVAVSPMSGPPGTGLSVSGTGWPAGHSIGVSLLGDGTSGSGGSICTLTADSSGNIAGDQLSNGCRVPTISGGGKPVRAQDPNNSAVANTAASNFTVTPAVHLDNNNSSSSVAAGATVQTSGDGFTAKSQITSVKLDTTTATSNPSTPFSTGFNDGTFERVFVTIPPGTTAGPHTLNLTDAGGHTGSVHVTVFRPTMTVAPTSGASGTGLTVSGDGWPAGGRIGISIGGPITGGSVCTLTADSNGNIAGDHTSDGCKVPTVSGGAGSKALVARDLDIPGVNITGSFTLTPGLLLDFSTGPFVSPGVQVVIDGRDFAANTTMASFTVDTTAAIADPATPLTTLNGNFSQVGVRIPAATTVGAHSLNATDAAGFTGSLDIAVFRPTLAVSPTSGAPGTALTVSGGGWPAGDTIEVKIDLGEVCALTADADGNIAGDQASNGCDVPVQPAGTRQLSARSVENLYVLTTGTFTVTSP